MVLMVFHILYICTYAHIYFSTKVKDAAEVIDFAKGIPESKFFSSK